MGLAWTSEDAASSRQVLGEVAWRENGTSTKDVPFTTHGSRRCNADQQSREQLMHRLATAPPEAKRQKVEPVDGWLAIRLDASPREHSFDSTYVIDTKVRRLGPTSVCAARLLHHVLTDPPSQEHRVVRVDDLAAALGVNTVKCVSALTRLVQFGWAHVPTAGCLVLSNGVGPVVLTDDATTASEAVSS